MPCSQDNLVVSGAADGRIQLSDVEKNAALSVFTAHSNRVKRLDVAQDEPSLFWSAAEDGLIL